jgi:RimJ/RimL family protein N-acetyltransferase
MDSTRSALVDAPDATLLLEGKRVGLGPIRRDLLANYVRWENSAELAALRGSELPPRTFESPPAWFDSASDNDVRFTIHELAAEHPQQRAIGMSRLFHIDRGHRHAELGIYLGERDAWGQGFGTEATRLTIDYAFNVLGLHNVFLRVIANNTRAIKAYERAGFRTVGRIREYARFAGGLYDVLVMDCIATEFDSPVLHGIRRKALGQ